MLDVEFLTLISLLVKNWGTVSFTVIVLNPKASEKKNEKKKKKGRKSTEYEKDRFI